MRVPGNDALILNCIVIRRGRGSFDGMNYDNRYPIGNLPPQKNLSAEERNDVIERLAELPVKLRTAVSGLSDAQLDTPYREGGWTLRQTVHHIADSHMQGYCRARKSMTEEWPPITTYEQQLWAELPDARTLPVEVSLQLLDSLHRRWAVLFRSCAADDWTGRGFTHPESGKNTLEQLLTLYDWHGRHHTAQISALRERMGW